ncbi:hypothetical protein BLNAU_20470 [Blattamonas nauphoetae]|uniref:Uncharacterized protein n=1 Tax=Blattamonas nauphoetae TaxID=2049346 RepID=A0ABQ9WYN3_9EUKA|nr:hypothetical protein BLNAU_20470 [Blattamonas nauphoetae]
MSQPQTQPTLPYRLIADANANATFTKDRNGVKRAPETRTEPNDEQIEVDPSWTIQDLYVEMAETVKEEHICITIQFPFTEPPGLRSDELPGQDLLDPSRVPLQAQEWIEKVGWSGYQYDTSVTIESLLACWPLDGENRKPMRVVAIPVTLFTVAPQLDSEEIEVLEDRLHIMGGIHDLFYTLRNDRIIWMSTLDSDFQKRRKVWIRRCWEEFRLVILKHFRRYNKDKLPELQVLEGDLNSFLLPYKYAVPADGEDKELWSSIGGIPDWISTERASESRFSNYFAKEPPNEKKLEAFFVKGQPGTGKSQMLLYLIHCLMQLEKVAILYILPGKPVFTIVVDRSNLSTPIRVRSHDSSFALAWYTRSFPVIRIVDTADPYPNAKQRGIFTVFTASPMEYKKHYISTPHDLSMWDEFYPFWKQEEFYTMMKDLGITGRGHWIRRVDADPIIDLHPIVISLLGTHGYIEDEPNASSGGEPAYEQPDADMDRSKEPVQHIEHQLTYLAISSPTQNSGVLPPSPASIPQKSTDISENDSDQPLIFFESNLPDPNIIRHPPQGGSRSDQRENLGISPPSNVAFVCLNVIEVFGLSPRALTTDLSDAFRAMSEVFGRDGVTHSESDATLVISSLSATHLKGQPVSEFANRLLTTMINIKAEDFLEKNSSKKILEALGGNEMEFRVNQQLFRSYMMFTVFTAIPDFPSFYFRFPSIGRCPMLLSRLCATPTLAPNVLYYEALYEPVIKARSPHWIGIDSFIFFLGPNSIRLFTFLNAVNPDRNETGNELIDLLKTQLENRYALTKPGVKVEVFFMWIVKPEDVPEYLEKVNHRYKTGVISVSDLLFNECSRMTGPLVKRPKIQLPWSKSTQDFKDCFVMKRNLTVDAQYQLGMRNQHDLHLDTNHQLNSSHARTPPSHRVNAMNPLNLTDTPRQADDQGVDAQFQLWMGNQPGLHLGTTRQHGDKRAFLDDDSLFQTSDTEEEKGGNVKGIKPQRGQRTRSARDKRAFSNDDSSFPFSDLEGEEGGKVKDTKPQKEKRAYSTPADDARNSYWSQKRKTRKKKQTSGKGRGSH